MKFVIFYVLLISQTLALSDFTLNSEKTLYIVDGDSISMQMRIYGIDAPEIKQTCKKTQHQIVDCGRESKAHLKKLLKTTSGKLLIKPVAFDHYNRILVRVHKGDIDIAKLMVAQGMAYSYKNIYRQEETLAKSKKLGFWGFYKPPIQPYKWRKKNPKRRNNHN